MTERDHFDDVRHIVNAQHGVLSGDGAESHYHAREKPSASGVAYQLPCDNCGRVASIDVSWDEFSVGAAGALPPGWIYSAQFAAMHPNIGCPGCRALLPLMLTPDECGKKVRAGVNAGAIDPNRVQQIQQQVRAQQGGYRR